MNTLLRRALARHLGVLALLVCAGAHAAGPDPAPLALEEAERMALSRQPLLDAQRATVRAARERAVAMRQLPDPMLLAGVQNLPVNGEDRYSLSMDPMTMTSIGVMQEFPLPGKRRLRGRAEALMADAGDAKLTALERAVQRDTSSPLKSITTGTALAVPVRVSATTAAERRFIPGKPMFLFSSG